LGGEPGVGKSTLMLQMANAFAEQGLTVLYVCGEESVPSKPRCVQNGLGIAHPNIYLYSETSYHAIKAQIDQLKPDIAIIDSVQIVYKAEIPSSPGSVVQVREIAMECMHISERAGDHDVLDWPRHEIG
jgi:DNA repair protein RadA/Sms